MPCSWHAKASFSASCGKLGMLPMRCSQLAGLEKRNSYTFFLRGCFTAETDSTELHRVLLPVPFDIAPASSTLKLSPGTCATSRILLESSRNQPARLLVSLFQAV